MTMVHYVEMQSVTVPVDGGQVSFDVLIEGETAKVGDRVACLLLVEPGSWLLCYARDTQLGLEVQVPWLANSQLTERIKKMVDDGFSGLRKVINVAVMGPCVRRESGESEPDRVCGDTADDDVWPFNECG